MVDSGGGAIVNIASVNALTHVGASAYSAAKAGVLAFTRAVAVEHGPDQVRCNVVVPGTFRTDVWNDRMRKDPQILERLTKWYPLGRIGTVDDIAGAVLFLSSDDAAWVTGTSLCVDGGLLAGNPLFGREVHP